MDPDKKSGLEEKRKRLEEMRKLRLEREKEKMEADSSASSAAPDNAVSEPIVVAKIDSTTVDNSQRPLPSAPKVLSTQKNLVKINILPKPKVVYEKGSQTDFDLTIEADNEDEEVVPYDLPNPNRRSVSFRDTKVGDSHKLDFSFIDQEEKKAKAEYEKKVADLQASAPKDKSFIQFFQKSSLFIERALCQNEKYDLLFEYGQSSDESKSSKQDENSIFNISHIFDDDFTKGRPIMDVKFCTQFPQLFLVAYGAKPSTTTNNGTQIKSFSSNLLSSGDEENPGLLCIWSSEMSTRPEFRFYAPSPILVAVFHTQTPQIVLGGCYNGQILLWDMRDYRPNSIQRSSVAGKGHKHPVYSLSPSLSGVIDEFLSISIDGMLCTWDSKRLAEPTSVVMLTLHNSPNSSLSERHGDRNNMLTSDLINISSMSIGNHVFDSSSSSSSSSTALNNNTNTSTHCVTFGSSSGDLFRYYFPETIGKEGRMEQSSAGHNGLITSVHTHPSHNKKYKHFILTSSLDWSVKLWSSDSLTKPLLEFYTSSYDYISDVQWSPTLPLVFCTLSSGGVLSVWNLGKSVTVPIESYQLSTVSGANGDALTTGATGGQAKIGIRGGAPGGAGHGYSRTFNKIVWSADGYTVLVGDSVGVVHTVVINHHTLSVSVDDMYFENVLSSLV